MVLHRLPLYLATATVVFALESLFLLYSHIPYAALYAAIIGAPLIIVVVTVNAFADATGTLEEPRERWGRILERAWAIILLDAGISIAQDVGIAAVAAAQAEIGALLVGFMVLWLTAMLVYAEPILCVEAKAGGLAALPLALLQSMTLAWMNLSRIFALFAVTLLFELADILIAQSSTGLGTRAAFLTIAYEALAEIPLATLYTVAYLETRKAVTDG